MKGSNLLRVFTMLVANQYITALQLVLYLFNIVPFYVCNYNGKSFARKRLIVILFGAENHFHFLKRLFGLIDKTF